MDFKLVGWICRCWTETSQNGWESDFATFPTREDAEEHGKIHNKHIKSDELSREFEVYADWRECNV